MTIETLPLTDLSTAANKVVDDLAAKRGRLPVIKWDGKPISKPGVYDIPIQAYHGDCCAGPSVSSSGLRTIENETPRHYFANSYLNPKRKPEEPNAAFDMGRAVHMLLLGEKGFRQTFAIRPEEWSDWRKKDAQEWRAAQVAAGKSVLTRDDVEAIREIKDSLAEDNLVKLGLLNGEIERSLIWQDKETGIWLKARPDALPVNADIIADLKTTTDASAIACQRTILEYGYHMQLALVGMGMEQVFGRKPGNDDYVLVFVEKKTPYCVNVKPVDIEWIGAGRMQIRRALRRFADCINKGEWPGYADNGQTASAPDWFRKKIEAEIQFGRLSQEMAA